MPTTIKLKNSVTTTNAPSSLAQGEVAINVTDKKVWVGNAATTPVQIVGAGSGGGGAAGSNTQVQYNSSGALAGNSNLTFDGSNLSIQGMGGFGSLNVNKFTATPYTTITLGDNADPANAVGLYFRTNASNPAGISTGGSPLAFYMGGPATSEAMRITSTGNVGIGTSSPSYKLDISGQNGRISFAPSTAFTYFDVANGHGTTRIGTDASAVGYVGTASNLPLAIYSGNTERIRIDTSGNVGIGTTATTTYRATIANNGGNQLRLYATDVATTTTNTIDFWYLDAGGSPYNNTSIRSLSTANAGNGSLVFYTRPTSGALTERMRITSNTDVLFGTTVTDPTFSRSNGVNIVSGSIYSRSASGWDCGLSSTSGNSINFYTDNGTARVSAGFISSNGGTSTYATSSDYRMKENIAPMAGALTKVTQLKPVTYTWKKEFAGTNANGQGFIAHELAEVCPEAVTGEKDAVDANGNPKYQGIDTSFLVATLTAAIQEQQAIISDLKARIETLESK
jgi:hypothetical protein